MKLVSCYVRSFGTIKDQQFYFNEGLNQFLCDNGVGKTTLITFIKAMLFGLEYRQGSKVKFYERKNYLPWTKEDCGGNLTFEAGGKMYRIERSFGKKAADDTLAVFDVDTNLPSEDYDNIGETLFGVDVESFEKSIYFGQGSITTGMTNSLNAKMGNLSNVRDDMNRYDEAIKSIDNAKSHYEKKSRTNPGKINVLDEKIKDFEDKISGIQGLENGIRVRRESIEDKRLRAEALAKEKEELGKRIKLAGEKKEKEGALKAKREQLLKLKESKEAYEKFFDGKTPTEEEILSMQEKLSASVERQSRITEVKDRMPSEDRIEFLSEVFAGEDAITGESIDIAKGEAEKIDKLRTSGELNSFPKESEEALNELKKFFEKKIPTGEEISGYRQLAEDVTRQEAEISALKDRLELEEEELKIPAERKGNPYFVISILGVLVAVLGMLVGVFLPWGPLTVTGLIAGLVIGCLMVVVSLMFSIQEKNNIKRKTEVGEERVKTLKTQIQKVITEAGISKTKCKDFLAKYDMEDTGEENFDILGRLMNIQRNLDEYERLMSLHDAAKKGAAKNTDELAELTLKLYTRLAGVGEKYGFDLYKDNNEKKLLEIISEDLKEYDSYLSFKESVKSLENDIKDINEELNLFMNRYSWEDQDGTDKRLLGLKGRLDKYNTTIESIRELEEELSENLTDSPDTKEEESLEVLQERLKEFDEKYEPLVSDRAKEEEELLRMLNELEEMEEIQRELPALKEKRAILQEKVALYVETKKYLEQAREEFLSTYMKPLNNGMDKYLRRFVDKEDLGDIDIVLDMNLGINLVSKGATYTGEHLSEGYKDLAAICARLSLIDVLYKNEKPPIFMDDPFTNLDQKKIQKALKLIEDISRDVQIVYMTCHDSRTLDGYKIFVS